MSLLSFLGPALTAGTEAAVGGMKGTEQGTNEANSKMMAMIQQIRAQHDDELKNQQTIADTQLKQAQASGTGAGFRPVNPPTPATHQLDDGTLVQIINGKAVPVQPAGASPAPSATPTTPPQNPEDTQIQQGLGGQTPTAAPVAPATVKGAGKPPLIHTFADGVKQSADGGKTWVKIGEAPEAQGSGTVLPGANGGPAQLVFTGGARAGQTMPLPDVDKNKAGTATSGMTMQVLNRLGMSAKDIRASIDQMNAYEKDPNGLAAVTPEMATKAQVATAQAPSENHGAVSTLNNAVGSYFTSKAQKAMADDPALSAYRTYLFNKQRVGLAFGETLPRVNQEIIKMESMMSGGDLSQNPALLKAVQERREYGAQQLESLLGNMPANRAANSGGRGGGGLSENAQKVQAALQAKQVTPQDVVNSTKLTPAEKQAILTPQP